MRARLTRRCYFIKLLLLQGNFFGDSFDSFTN